MKVMRMFTRHIWNIRLKQRLRSRVGMNRGRAKVMLSSTTLISYSDIQQSIPKIIIMVKSEMKSIKEII
jgi:hypothetical protein